jgi:hypothetical protein
MTLKTISSQTQLFLRFLGELPPADLADIEAETKRIEFTVAPVAPKGRRKAAARKPRKARG